MFRKLSDFFIWIELNPNWSINLLIFYTTNKFNERFLNLKNTIQKFFLIFWKRGANLWFIKIIFYYIGVEIKHYFKNNINSCFPENNRFLFDKVIRLIERFFKKIKMILNNLQLLLSQWVLTKYISLRIFIGN